MSVEVSIRRILSRALTSVANEEYVNIAEVADKVLKAVSKLRVGDIPALVDKHVQETLFDSLGDWTLNELMEYIWAEKKAAYTEWDQLQARPIVLRRPYSTFLTYVRLPEVIADLRLQYRRVLTQKASVVPEEAVLMAVEVKEGVQGKNIAPRRLRPYLVNFTQKKSDQWEWQAILKYPAPGGGDDHLKVEMDLHEGSPHIYVYQDDKLKLTIAGHGDGLAIRYGEQQQGIELHGLEGQWLLIDREDGVHTGHEAMDV
jgi:hypothetical protein